MQKFSLSIITIACGLALTGCSSHKDTVNDFLDSQSNKAQLAANQKVTEAKAAQQVAEIAKSEVEQKLAEAQAAATTAAEKAAETQKNLEQQLQNALNAQQQAEERANSALNKQQVLEVEIENANQVVLRASQDAEQAVQTAQAQVTEANTAKEKAEKQVVLAEQQIAESTTKQKEAEQQAKQAIQAQNAAEEALKSAQSEKELAEQVAVDTQQAKLEAEKQAAENLLAKQAAEEEKMVAEQRVAEFEQVKAEEQARIERNITETQQAVKDNGTFEKTYLKSDPYTWWEEPKEVTLELTNVNGKHLVVENGVITDKALAEQQDLNKLIVDGKEIVLFSPEEITQRESQSENIVKSLDSDGVVGKVGSLPKSRYGSDFAQLRYGYVTDENGKTHLFIQGHTTPETGRASSPFDTYYYGTSREDQSSSLSAMPSEQVWVYKGSAFYGSDGSYQQLDVEAVADFNEKKVRADLKEGSQTKVTLGGVIDGNRFGGEYNGVYTQGAFYGDTAQDMGGLFYQADKEKNGVFGATSQGHSWRGGVDVPEKSLVDFQVK